MNNELKNLHTYPFERLSRLLAPVTCADKSPILLSIGEPKHAPPRFVLDALSDNLDGLNIYPKTKGLAALRLAISAWLESRYGLKQGTIDHESQVLPVAGTREGLFSFIQASVHRKNGSKVLIPNPFYQIYEGATILAGSKPVYLNTSESNGFVPDFDEIDQQTWKDCQLLIICNPGNPTGAVIPEATLIQLIHLADQYDFILASDECYSEIYFNDKPPVGLLEVCANMGRNDFKRCIVFHSLSKRSNLPGLRSGFVAGDADILKSFLLYRTYHGSALSEPVQQASITAWADEQHVIENRQLYKEKFDAVLDIFDGHMDVKCPEASFYLWLKLPDDDLVFCKKLYEQENVTLLPGQFLSREADGINPGSGYARMALVAPKEQCIEAANRITSFLERFYSQPVVTNP